MPSAAKAAILRHLSIGSRVAEDEVEELGRYFVETDQWRRIFAGEVDIVFGPKGAGKSAIYTSLTTRARELKERDIILLAGENPRGAPAFADLVADPPTSEHEFIGIWKFYVLSLLAGVLDDVGLGGDDARRVREALESAGLSPGPGGLRGTVRRVREYVSRLLEFEAVEGAMAIDPATGMPVGFTGKITLGEPSASARAKGITSVDELLTVAAEELAQAGVSVWVVFDRLDVAFAESMELEANALRALFKVYLDLLSIDPIRLKIFLRSDIWSAITKAGFREASHITRTATISWTNASLMNVIVRRLLQNPALIEAYGVDPEAVLGDAAAQRQFFDTLVPDQIDSGRNPRTFEWMLGRVADGTKLVAPRELIHLLGTARDDQLAALERGESEPENGMLFSRQAFRDALPEVSKVRLEQTLFAEYPAFRDHLEALRREKTQHTAKTLAAVWGTSEDDAQRAADQLVEIGFFERRGSKATPIYWVPFLYRPALELVQGSADTGVEEQEEVELPFNLQADNSEAV